MASEAVFDDGDFGDFAEGGEYGEEVGVGEAVVEVADVYSGFGWG